MIKVTSHVRFVRLFVNGSFPSISGISVLDKLTYAGTLDNLPLSISSSQNFIQGDICDPILIRSLLTEVDAVINFAAETHVDRSILGATDFVQTNILGQLHKPQHLLNSYLLVFHYIPLLFHRLLSQPHKGFATHVP